MSQYQTGNQRHLLASRQIIHDVACYFYLYLTLILRAR